MYPSDETQSWLPSYITAYVEPTPPTEDDEQEPAEASQTWLPSYIDPPVPPKSRPRRYDGQRG